MIDLLVNYEFLRNAIIVAVLASIISGIIGTIVVEKRLVSMAGGIAHGTFGGIGLGFFLGIEPIIGGFLFSIISSLVVGKINRTRTQLSDTIVSVIWSLGMALGILFIALTPGYPPDMSSYLFGNILTVSSNFVIMIFVLAVVVILVIYLLFNYFKLYLFDEQYAMIIGINTILIENILYVLIGITVVVLIKSVGIILSIALLTIPPLTAKKFSNSLSKIMFLSVLFSIFYSFIGIYLSYVLSVPSGASIIIVSAAIYIILVLLKRE